MFRDNTKLNLNYADTFSCMDKNYIWNSEECSCEAQMIRFWVCFLEVTSSSPINFRATKSLHGR
jgi:hypothetical protein